MLRFLIQGEVFLMRVIREGSYDDKLVQTGTAAKKWIEMCAKTDVRMVKTKVVWRKGEKEEKAYKSGRESFRFERYRCWINHVNSKLAVYSPFYPFCFSYYFWAWLFSNSKYDLPKSKNAWFVDSDRGIFLLIALSKPDLWSGCNI